LSVKVSRKNLTEVDAENRCQICDNKLTFYPKDFIECPHCLKKVCRPCWATAWDLKSFSANQCAHLTQKDEFINVPYAKKEKNINWDWPRIALVGFFSISVLCFLYFVFSFLVF